MSINLTGGINYFTVSFTPSKEIDVVGYLIHASNNPNFIPSRLTVTEGGNLINNGPETSLYYKCSPGTWYVRIAPYDTFEDIDNIDTVHLNYTSALPVTVYAPDAIVLPDEIYNELRTDFIVNDVQFYFGAIPYDAALKATLYWNGGSTGEIIRGTSHYALTGTGNIVNANGKYVVATLNDNTNTATLSVIPISSGISLASNEIIIAVTSDNPLVSNSNNICYLRQANSQQYEGALIRYATITDAHITGTLSASKIVANWSSIIDDDSNKPSDNADATQTVIDGGLVTTGRIEVGSGALGSVNAGINGSGTAGTDIRFWAGSTYENAASSAKFKVDQNGKLTCTGADIRGTLNASDVTAGTFNASLIGTGALRGINVNAASHTTKGSFLTQFCNAADTTLYLHNADDFDTSGSGWLIGSVNDRDAFSWTGKDGNNLTGCTGVLAHPTYTTVIPKVKNIVIDSSSNEMRFFGDDGNGTGTVTELASIGISAVGSDYAIGSFGSTTTKNWGIAAYSGSGASYAIYCQSHGLFGLGIAADETNTAGHAVMIPGTRATVPNSSIAGSFYVTSDGHLHYRNATAWVQIA